MARIHQYGTTWWGKAWLDALEQRALVDPNRLPRGRTYARQERVTEVEVSPGRLRAKAWGSRPDPYSTSLSLRTLTDTEWDLVLDTVMSKAGNVAALLSGEVPESIGSLVLPDRGDLGPACSCPDWAEPCKHAAALCYVAADLFDADPFALLMLRGRSRDQVLTEVRARRSAHLGVAMKPTSHEPRGADPGVPAGAAFKRTPASYEKSPPLVHRPGTMVPLAVPPGADAGIDVRELSDLVADAAERAWAMLAGEGASGLDLSVGADVVRRAARGDVTRIAERTGLDQTEFAAAVAAWRIAGLAGFLVHRGRIDVDVDAMTPGRLALGSDAKVRGNTVSHGGIQLRLDDRGRWWRFRADDELGWLLVDGPADDPADLVEM